MSIKNPSGRLARWSLSLQEYDMNIEYRSGKLHGNCDSLSRIERTPNVVAGVSENLPSGLQLDRIRDLQNKDPNLRPLINYLKDGSLPDDVLDARKIVPVFRVMNYLRECFTISGRQVLESGNM